MNSDSFLKNGPLITFILKVLDDDGFRHMLEDQGEWKTLANALEVPKAFLENIQVDCIINKRSIEEVLTSVLIEWKLRCGHEASISSLISILESTPTFSGIAHWIRNKLHCLHKAEQKHSVSWRQLSPGTQADILCKEVYFLGSKQKLFQIADQIGESQLLNILESDMAQGLLGKLMKSKTTDLELTKTILPKPMANYRERTVIPLTCIDSAAIRKLNEDIVAIEGIDWSTLSVLAESPFTEKSGNITVSLDSETRFILLEKRDQFDSISKLTKRNIHLLSGSNQNDDICLTWIRTKGCPQALTNFMKKEACPISESQFINDTLATHTKSVNIFTASCGHGKSTLLSSLARKVQKSFPDRPVLFLNATDLLQNLQDRDYQTIVDFLASRLALAEETFTSKLLHKILSNQKSQIELFVQGYHLISLEQRDIVNKTIITLFKSPLSIRVFITSTSLTCDLEQNNVTLIRYKLTDFFQDVDVASYLASVWCEQLSIPGNDNITNFAKVCLTEVFPTGGISASKGVFCGISEQLHMFAELNKTLAEVAAYGQKISLDKIDLPKSVYEMYKKYMALQINPNVSAENLLYDVALRQICWKGSFSSYFHNSRNHQILHSDVSKLLRSNWISQDFEIFPKSIAEYLVADSFVKILGQQGHIYQAIPADDIWRFIFQLEVSPEPKTKQRFLHSTICYFLNEMFQEFGLLKNERILQQVQTFLQKNSATFSLSSILQACTQHQFYSLFCLLGHCIDLTTSGNHSPVRTISSEEWKTLLLSATQNANLDLVRKFSERVKFNEKKPLSEIKFQQEKFLDIFITPLHIAIRRGNYKIFQYFMGEYGQSTENNKRLLHAAVENSHKSVNGQLAEKEEVVKYLIQKSKGKILEEKGTGIPEPVLVNGIRVTLLKLLIQSTKEIIKVKTGNNETVAHKATSYLTTEEYHQLVELLISSNNGDIFNQRNHNYETAFELAMRALKIGNKTVKLIIECPQVQADPNMGYKHTLLYHLLANGYSDPSVYDAALKKESGWKEFVYQDGSTSLLHEAAEFGNVQALQYFISKGAAVDALNKERKTPLHIACEKRQSKEHLPERVLEAVTILMNNGAPIDALDKCGRNPLSLFFENHLMPMKKRISSKEEDDAV